MRTLAGLCAALLLSACVASGGALAPPQTVEQVDLSRYQGTWYELARLPMFFQRNCVQSEAHYRLRDDERIEVTNRCRDDDGEWQEARGVAEPQVETGRLDLVGVEGGFRGDRAAGDQGLDGLAGQDARDGEFDGLHEYGLHDSAVCLLPRAGCARLTWVRVARPWADA